MFPTLNVEAHDHSTQHVNHELHHPNGSRTHTMWAQEQTLHVAVAFTNPHRWNTRLHLFNNFRRHMNSLPNVKLHVGEVAFGNRPFEATSADNPLDFQFRTTHTLWLKECALNAVIRNFSPEWQYGAIIDGDFCFTRQDIALETIHMLQHHPWVQMFSSYTDLDHYHTPLRVTKGFAQRWVSGEIPYSTLTAHRAGVAGYYDHATGVKSGPGPIGATGGAWAFRRHAFNDVGGLLDICILGSSDWHMALGLAGLPDHHPNVKEMTECGKHYAAAIANWQNRAARVTKQNIGYVNCLAVHYFHGSKQRRGYDQRWKVLRDHDYNPNTDVYRDHHGILQLDADKIGLRDGIRRYFLSRVEDDISVSPAEHQLFPIQD